MTNNLQHFVSVCVYIIGKQYGTQTLRRCFEELQAIKDSNKSVCEERAGIRAFVRAFMTRFVLCPCFSLADLPSGERVCRVDSCIPSESQLGSWFECLKELSIRVWFWLQPGQLSITVLRCQCFDVHEVDTSYPKASGAASPLNSQVS